MLYIPIENGIILFCPVHFSFSSRNLFGSNRFGSGNVSASIATDRRFGMTIAPFGIVYPFHSTKEIKSKTVFHFFHGLVLKLLCIVSIVYMIYGMILCTLCIHH